MNKEGPEGFYIIVMKNGKEAWRISCPADLNLLEAMREHGIRLASACGGSGYCGKCRIRLLKGSVKSGLVGRSSKTNSQEGNIFTEDEIRQGWLLACRVYPSDNCVIELATDEEDFEVIADYRAVDLPKQSRQPYMNRQSENEPAALKPAGSPQNTDSYAVKRPDGENSYAIAVDIGTSTVVQSLIRIEDGMTLATYSAVNPQRAYGADVIARLQMAGSGRMELLQKLIKGELLRGIRDMAERAGIDTGIISRMAIACNTTMGHILLGYSCEGLGKYPYTPVNISKVELPFIQLFDSDYLDASVTVLPGISTFVGGDIVAGLLACNFDKADKPCLFIDLGTNGELALGNKERLLVSSAAAGPAFEGGNISCGMPSVAGAICNIEIANGKTLYRTIGDKEAAGLCGTGIVELVSELLDAGIIDETGLLTENYFLAGFPIKGQAGSVLYFTQRDIRHLQMAKAAIRAGIDILLKEYGIGYDDIDKVYLAGGFGYMLNLKKAVNIGLLPKEVLGRIYPVGNSALGGAISYLRDKDAPVRIEKILKSAAELALAQQEDFNSLYPEYMYFR